MRRYMTGIKGGTCVASRDGVPLEDWQLERAVPALFATEAHESRSSRFAPISTIHVLDGLRNEGFEPFYAIQAAPRDETRHAYCKHMLRLRHKSLARSNGDAFEVILVNANDGSAAYQMLPGFFRFVCANGLMTGDTFGAHKVRHSGDAVSEVIEGAYTVLGDAPRVADQVARFQGTKLLPTERDAFAEAALTLRFPDATEDNPAPISAERLLDARRRDDVGTDAWRTFNTVQENVIRGGLRGWSGLTPDGRRTRDSRRTTTREVKGIDQQTALNRALWTLTERLLEIRAAA